MVPPIDVTDINSKKDASNAIKTGKITKEKAKFIAEAFAEIEGNREAEAKIKINYKYLLNKPNMTDKDKENMEKSIKFLINKKMDTSENIKKLEAILYYQNYIEIGGVKRARENLKAEPNKGNIFKYGDEVYFKFNTLKKQNKLLAKQGMEIPSKESFIKTLFSLPGKYSETSWYAGANIMGTILGLSMSNGCDSYGELNARGKGEYGYIWSSSEKDSIYARNFGFNKDEGRLGQDSKGRAVPVRPIFK